MLGLCSIRVNMKWFIKDSGLIWHTLWHQGVASQILKIFALNCLVLASGQFPLLGKFSHVEQLSSWMLYNKAIMGIINWRPSRISKFLFYISYWIFALTSFFTFMQHILKTDYFLCIPQTKAHTYFEACNLSETVHLLSSSPSHPEEMWFLAEREMVLQKNPGDCPKTVTVS